MRFLAESPTVVHLNPDCNYNQSRGSHSWELELKLFVSPIGIGAGWVMGLLQEQEGFLTAGSPLYF